MLPLYILLFLSAISCDPEAPQPDPDPKVVDTVMQIIWNEPIAPGLNGFTSIPRFWNNNLIFSTSFFYQGNTIQSRNALTGKLNWEQNNTALGSENGGNYNCGIYEDQMIWENANIFLNINLANGEIIKNKKIKDAWMGPRCSLLNDHIYSNISDKSIQQVDNYLVRRQVNSALWDTLITISKEDGYTKFIETPALSTINNDSLLLFSVGKWHFPESRAQTDFYCFSLKDRQIKWRLKDWDKDGSSVRVPIVFENKVYFQGHHTLYCIEIESGEQLWKYVMPEYLSTLDINQALIAENKLILKPNSHSIYALNPHTGILDWKNDDSGGNVNKINYANGMIIYTANFYLFVVDIRNGKTIWKKKSPNDKGGEIGFNGFIPCGVNAQDSVIYAADEQNIMAINMPKLK